MPGMKKRGGGLGDQRDLTKRQRKVRAVRKSLAQPSGKTSKRAARILSRPNGAAILKTAKKRGPLPRFDGGGRKKHR